VFLKHPRDQEADVGSEAYGHPFPGRSGVLQTPLLHILSPQPIVKRAMENNNPHAINYASKCILSLGEMDISKG
jgi:hypothetical protein